MPLQTPVEVVLLTWYPPLFVSIQIDPRFLPNLVEIILARSRPFVRYLSQMFQVPARKAKSGAPDPGLSSKKRMLFFIVYSLMRLGSVLISEVLTTIME